MALRPEYIKCFVERYMSAIVVVVIYCLIIIIWVLILVLLK